MPTAERAVDIALAGVQEELAKHRAGSGTVSTPQQLELIEKELTEMLQDLRQGRFMPERMWLGHCVVDSWPLTHMLTEQICAAAQAYSRENGD